ncbi:MAG: hypothetical protein QM813_27405 [Verrucomicrobiota bacterium]
MLACLFAANWGFSSVADRYLHALGFGLDSTHAEVQFVSASEMCCVVMFSVSHQSIVVPLTLLAAWLLLSKPRNED